MVIASVVTDVLNRVLGNYIVNLDKKQLDIGIWGGDVVLRNLRLRENAFDALDLPIYLTYGYLGELVLKIPWKNLYSQPVIAHISDLYILVSPKETVEFDGVKEEKYELEAKLLKLHNIDLARKMELNLERPKADKNFVEKLTALIINNLQIKIANIHLRYEDSVTMKTPCAVGLTLYNLQLYTTDETWQKSFISEPTADLCKVADLDSLSAYMNCNKSSLYSENMFEVKQLFETNIASQEHIPKDYNYILGPISVHAKLKLNMNPENTDPPFSAPKISLLLEMKKLNMGITTTQFQYVFRLSQDMSRMQLAMPFRKYRPFNISYTGNYKKWWYFAITCVLEETVRRNRRNWKWEHIKNHRKLCHKYYDIYIAKETTAKPGKDVIEACDALEKELDVFNIILIRNQCYLQVDKIRQSQEKIAPASNSWFSGWSIWGSSDASKGKTDDIQTKLVSAMTSDEKGQLYDAIGYHESVTDVMLPGNYEAIKMEFKLAALEIGLYDDNYEDSIDSSEPIIEMKTVLLLRLDKTRLDVIQRPGNNAIKIIFNVKGLVATGLKKFEDTPVLIKSPTDDSNLMDVLFETNPLDKKCDKRLKISARPIDIIFDSDTILHLLRVFKPPKSFDFSKLEEATLVRMSNLKEQSVAGMKYMIEKHEYVELDIVLLPIIIKIPEKGKFIKNVSSMIVLSLGKFTISTEPRFGGQNDKLMSEKSIESQDLMQNMISLAYDKFKVQIADVQLLIVKSGESWRDILEADNEINEMYVLYPTSFICDFHMCIIEDDPRLPKTKISVLLPSIHINVADSRIFEAINIITSIPLPETEETPQLTLDSKRSSDLLRTSTRSLGKLFDAPHKRKSHENDGNLQEIVQYTDLEAQFTLKEFKVTLYRTQVKDDVSETSSTYETPLDETKDIPVEEPTPDSTQPIKFLELNIILLEIEAVKKTYELGASVRLGAIKLDQNDIFMGQETTLPIIDTPRFTDIKEYLFTIMYVQTDKHSPEFVSKYHSVVQSITLNFSSLVVTLHQECLLSLINIANQFQIKLEEVLRNVKPRDRQASSTSKILEKLTTIQEEQSDELVGNVESEPVTSKSSMKKKVVDQINFKVTANVDQVSIKLTCRKRDIADFKINDFEAGLILKSSYTEFTLLLKDILIIDSNPESIHSIIMQVIGQNALNCKLILYNLEETSNYNNNDMKIDVMVGCIEIVFLNWFVSSLLTFVNNFQNALEVFANAATLANQNVVDVYKKTTRMKFNIKIKAPVIVVPTNSKSLYGLALDLGYLDIQNHAIESYDKSENQSLVIVDEIKLELKELKLSTITILQRENSITLINEKEHLEEKKYKNILDPINLTLNVKRNLSKEWYHKLPDIDASGVVKSIDLNVYADDYRLIMLILDKNLSEGQNEFEEIIQPKTQALDLSSANEFSRKFSSVKHFAPIEVSHNITPQKKQQSTEQLKFNFQFEGVLINLIESDENHLAKTGINFLSIKGRKLVDGTLSTSVVLCDIFVDDTRPSSKNKINQYIKRKENSDQVVDEYLRIKDDNLATPDSNLKYMLDLVVMMKPDDMFAECRVSGFDLIISIDFLLKVSQFFITPKEYIPVIEATTFAPELQLQKTIPVQATSQVQVETPQTGEKKMKFIVHLNQPDIILVENLNDLNAHAIIFNMVSNLSYRSIGERQMIFGEIGQLKMFMCSFAPELREQTMHYIIHPCSITLQGSTPEGQGLHISLNVSDVIINISPATIDLFNQAVSSITTTSEEKTVESNLEKDYKDIWKDQHYKEKEFWFTKVEKAVEATEVLGFEDTVVELVKPEKCIIDVPSIIIIFETGLGYYTTPMLCMETKMSAVASNWSTQLSIEGKLNLFINYYNLELAVWEPFIELNERLNRNNMPEYGPWELNCFINVGSKDKKGEDALTKIKIESADILELTLTKTSYQLLMTLSEAFSQALDVKGLEKPEFTAPFVCINETGFDMNIDFTKGIFIIHDCHIPSKQINDSLNSSVVIRSNKNSNQIYADEVKACTVSSGGRLYLKTKMLTECLDASQMEYNLHVRIGEIDKDIILPVSKADKRYFPLCRDTNQEPWGIISQVISEFGTTKILIHGVVIIQNHFEKNISVHRNNPKGEKILIGEIKPNEKFYVPLHSIYANPKELYFSLQNYNISEQGIKWNDTLTDLDFTKQIDCVNRRGRDIFYLNAIREKIEVYQENTSKFTISSSYYIFHLRPPLYLCNALPIPIKVSVSNCTLRRRSVTEALEAKENNVGAGSKVVECHEYGEVNVSPGAVLHLPTVKLNSKANEAKNYVVVRLIQYLEKDWSCTTEVSETHNEFETWIFSSYDSVERMDIELGVRFEKRTGSLLVTVFSPFWMINKTGLMLTYKTFADSIKMLYHPPTYNGPVLCSFRQKGFFDKKHTSIRVDNGAWSDKIPLDVAGSNGLVVCETNELKYKIGVENHLTHNSLTKQITFIPYYMAINKCGYTIEIQENTRPGDRWIKIEQNECAPFWPKGDKNSFLIAKIAGDNQVTVPFNYNEGHCTLLKLDKNPRGGINVDVQVNEGCIYLTFSNYTFGLAPGLLINHTKATISFWEKGNVNEKFLKPNHKLLFTWSDPTGEKVILWKDGNNTIEFDLRRDGVGQFMLQKYKNNVRTAYWVSFLDGLQRVLLFTDKEAIATAAESSASLQEVTQEIEICLHGIGISVFDNKTGNDLVYMGITNSGVIWESKKKGKKYFKQMKIAQISNIESKYQQYLNDMEVGAENKYYLEDNKQEIDFNRMKLFKGGDREIQRTFYPGIWLQLKTSSYQTQFHFKINRIQIDNQLSDCIFPVILAPLLPPKSIANSTVLKPFIECSVVQRIVPNSNVKQFKYCSMLIQEFAFKVDIIFLMALTEMFASDLTDEQNAKLFNIDVDNISKPLSELIASHSLQEQKHFYDNLHLGPIKIHLSFSMAGVEPAQLPGILSTIIQTVGVTLTDVNDVVFRLAFFEREYQFYTQRQLISEIITHYTGQALKQLYVLVFGLDVLGNPYGLVVGITKGVEDLFYEPFQGAIQGPGEFAEGVVLGVKSLFGHTVGGAAGAVSKITGAMGKGLAALTFDKEYQRKRRQALNKKPTNFQEGIARSGKGLVTGVYEGVTGVFTKPISGAKSEGVGGFFKGLGKGAIGLVAHPTAGVVDFASGSLEAVKRAASSVEDVQRLRQPRFLRSDNIVRAYSAAEAMGNKLLKEIEKGKYASTDIYEHLEVIVEKQVVLLLSNHRVIYATKSDLFGTWTIQWTFMWNEICNILCSETGVLINLKSISKKVMGMFSKDQHNKLVSIPNQTRKENLAKIMQELKTKV